MRWVTDSEDRWIAGIAGGRGIILRGGVFSGVLIPHLFPTSTPPVPHLYPTLFPTSPGLFPTSMAHHALEH